MSTRKIIRDPVHGYINVLPHEVDIIDDSVTQRLRNVMQTGFAFEVFPEARTSRFSHSIGAMHLASRAFGNLIENSSADAKERFFEAMRDVRKSASEETISMWDERVTQISNSWPYRIPLSADERGLLVWAECSVRLAALFHDIGHLPFSHDFEFALMDYIRIEASTGKKHEFEDLLSQEIEIHEHIGVQVARSFLKKYAHKNPELTPLCWLAIRILKSSTKVYSNHPKPKASVEVWLHSIVDGEIDVDRIDYLLRDGRNLGFEFAQFDIDRLLSSMVMEVTDDDGFITAIDPHGVAAAETFFMARARSNQLMVRHHKVSQIGAAFRKATTAILKTSKEAREIISGVIHGEPDAVDKFARFDDVAWTFEMRSSSELTDFEKACRDTALYRSRSFKSAWKKSIYVSDLDALNKVCDNPVTLKEMTDRLAAENMLVLVYKFKPYRIRPDGNKSVLLVRKADGTQQPASECSAILRSLDAWWASDNHIYVCGMESPDMMRRKVSEILSSLKSADSATKTPNDKTEA